MAGPFKMKGSPMQRNFGVGSPVKKISSYAEAKKKDPNLDTYIAERKKHEPGSAEYESAQAKVNVAYGAKRSEKLKTAQVKKVTEAKGKAKGVERTEAHKERYTVKKAEKGVAKAQKDIKTAGKEVAKTVTKKDLRKEKKTKIKAIRDQAKSLKGTEGVSRKDIRKAKRADIKATRQEYKTAKKTLKTLKKT